MTLDYKGTFGPTESKSASVMRKQMTGKREQYGSTVHLFIDAGRSPRKITSMSITFVNGLWKSIEAPKVFSSLSRFPLVPSHRSFPAYSFGYPRPSSSCHRAEASLRTASAALDLRLTQPSSWSCSISIILNPKIPVHIIHLENIVKSCF
jgi:hypothetical protein